MATPCFVLRLTGSTLATGLSLPAGTVPPLLIGQIAGALADRRDRWRTMIATAWRVWRRSVSCCWFTTRARWD
ncbi:hypothetical protein OG607_01510 [Streptomyces sp. NBC_01537]|uniref:hypothetical protein n=1 Tax=Streptomyces sp. NBC_01537 TaxID=2903896 RepID=UPI00386A2808